VLIIGASSTGKDYEKRIILEALEKSNWVKTKAARLLHINRTTLVKKIKKQKLPKLLPSYDHAAGAFSPVA